MTLGPNDLLPCGTPTARRRHLARAERCTVCGTPWPETDPSARFEITKENA